MECQLEGEVQSNKGLCVLFFKMQRIIACCMLMGMNKEGKEERIGGENPLVTEAYGIQGTRGVVGLNQEHRQSQEERQNMWV